MPIGEKIRELRKAKGLSQNQLAEEIESVQALVSAWEIGKCDPHIFSCIMLADFFNISLDELCCRDFKGEK